MFMHVLSKMITVKKSKFKNRDFLRKYDWMIYGEHAILTKKFSFYARARNAKKVK